MTQMEVEGEGLGNGERGKDLLELTQKELKALGRTDPIKTLVKLLDEAQGVLGSSYSGVYDRFLEFGIGVMKVMPVQQTWDMVQDGKIKLEMPDYLWCLMRYKEMLEYWQNVVIQNLPEKVIALFGQGVAVLNKCALEYLETGVTASKAIQGPDLLGPLYMEYIASHRTRDFNGQFFTPWAVAKAMAEMLMGDCQPGEPGEPLRIAEPACGAGGLILATFEVIRHNNPQLLEKGLYFVEMIDIDRTCTLMAEFNIMLNRIPMYKRSLDEKGRIVDTVLVRIITGNALTLDYIPDDQRQAFFELQKQQMAQRRATDPDYKPTPPKQSRAKVNSATQQEEPLAFDWGEMEFKPKSPSPAPPNPAATRRGRDKTTPAPGQLEMF